MNRKDYFNFETYELLTAKELKLLISNDETPLTKAELLSKNLWSRIAIVRDKIHVRFDDKYEDTFMIGNDADKYITIMVRKLVDQSVYKYIEKSRRCGYCEILQKKWYIDVP